MVIGLNKSFIFFMHIYVSEFSSQNSSKISKLHPDYIRKGHMPTTKAMAMDGITECTVWESFFSSTRIVLEGWTPE